MDFDTSVKMEIYRTFAEEARAPTSLDLANALGASPQEVEAAFGRLHQKRLLVPEPGRPSHIRMAPPFSGIETSFPVRANHRRYFANCVWDAFGIAAALKADVDVDSEDAQTGEPIPLQVRQGRPVPRPCVVHFAVPAARWWDDIVHT